MTPRSPTRMLARHCDRYVVTLASPVGAWIGSPYVVPFRRRERGPEPAAGTHEMPRDGPVGACDVRFEDPLYPAPH